MELEIEILEARSVPLHSLTYVVIGAMYRGKCVFVRNHERDTWEMPAGHIEKGETADQAAVRELYEETGAIKSSLDHIHDYGLTIHGKAEYGRLYAATIIELEALPEHEIEEISFRDDLPDTLTYPVVQTHLFYLVKTHFQSAD